MSRWMIGTVVLLAVGLALGLQAVGADQAKDAGGAAVVDGGLARFRKERVEAAREMIADLQKRVEAGEALTPEFIRLQADAYWKSADAEIAAAATARERVAAAEQYVERCRQVLNVVEGRLAAGVDVSRVQVSQAKYQLADAQCMLAEQRAK